MLWEFIVFFFDPNGLWAFPLCKPVLVVLALLLLSMFGGPAVTKPRRIQHIEITSHYKPDYGPPVTFAPTKMPKRITVYGWKRLKRVGLYGQDWKSPVQGTIWINGHCESLVEPSEHNDHGIYLYKTREQAERSRYSGLVVHVKGSEKGVIIEHEDGYRVQIADVVQ